jgi:hypothetical protein
VQEARRVIRQRHLVCRSHAWDIAGAKHSGFKTLFVQQEEKVYPSGCFPEPDITASNVSEGVDKLLGASN